jgi:hypothetical protein
MTTALLTVLALIAFAANSIFARLALSNPSIDPASYTTVRLVTGAATLWLIARFRQIDESAVSSGGGLRPPRSFYMRRRFLSRIPAWPRARAP